MTGVFWFYSSTNGDLENCGYTII